MLFHCQGFDIKLRHIESRTTQKGEGDLDFFVECGGVNGSAKSIVKELNEKECLAKELGSSLVKEPEEGKICFMMTSSNGYIFRVTGLYAGNSPVTGEFPSQRPVTRSFNEFFNLGLNKRLSKQSRRRWFETPSCALWRHCNVIFFNKSIRCRSVCISYKQTWIMLQWHNNNMTIISYLICVQIQVLF